MTSEIISNMPLNHDFETEWLPVEYTPAGFKRLRASSLQINWREILGAANGTIEILTTNDQDKYSLAGSYQIDSFDNSTDCLMVILYPAYEYIKIRYTKHLITSGLLTAIINYQ